MGLVFPYFRVLYGKKDWDNVAQRQFVNYNKKKYILFFSAYLVTILKALLSLCMDVAFLDSQRFGSIIISGRFRDQNSKPSALSSDCTQTDKFYL